MSLQSVERAGIISYLAAKLARGEDEDDAISDAQRLYPGESYTTFQLAWRDAGYAAAAGAAVAGLGPGQTIPAADVPGYYPGRTGYLYTIFAQFDDVASGDTNVRTITVYAPTQYDATELWQAVADGIPDPSIGGSISAGYAAAQPTWVMTSVDVISLERQ